VYRKPIEAATGLKMEGPKGRSLDWSAGDPERGVHRALRDRERMVLLEVNIAALTEALSQGVVLHQTLDARGEAFEQLEPDARPTDQTGASGRLN
jgi:hypothetical protein